MNQLYRCDIDGLRGIAVLGVVTFHIFPLHLSGGFVGVDIFFVISGYLITSMIYSDLEKNKLNFCEFYYRRVRRIFPVLILVLAFTHLVGWFLLSPIEYKQLGIHVAAASIFGSNLVLYKESGYFDAAADTKPLLHLWSLAIEEQFYIIWPVILYVSRKNNLNSLTITVALTLGTFLLNVVKAKTDAVGTFYLPMTRMWEILIGACLAFMTNYPMNVVETIKKRLDTLLVTVIYAKGYESRGDTLRNVFSTVGTLFILLSMYLIRKTYTFPGWLAVFPTIGTVLVISAGPTSWINIYIFSSPWLVRMGLISYSLYLWHWPVLVYALIFFEHQISTYIRLLLIICSIVIAYISYLFLEKPFRSSQFSIKKWVVLGTMMSGVGLIGYHTYETDGLSHRRPYLIQELAKAAAKPEYQSRDIREYTCFLTPYQNESNFKGCVDNMQKPNITSVILWGDSHAAHLYPGIRANKPDIRLTQLTASACPPILEIHVPDRPFCRQINNYIFQRISNEKPCTVIMAAAWFLYKWEKLKETIARLNSINITNIYVVGPVPVWQDGLPKCLYNHFLHDKSHNLPRRLRKGLILDIDVLDKKMQEFCSKEIKVSYASPYQILCNPDGCLTRAGDDIGSLIALDSAHLTVAGSRFLVSHFPSAVFCSKPVM